MKPKIKILFIVALQLALLLSCSVEKNHRILSFFFDGVVLHDSSGVAAAPVTALADQGEEPSDTATRMVIDVLTLHYPFEEKDCMSCHNENSPGEMVMPEPDLCNMCHEDFSSVFPVTHGPAGGGFCTSCHDAHQSRNDYLLTRQGQDLCTWCHDLKQAPDNDMHSDLGDTECTLCHNPHGGEDKFLMR